MFGMLASAICSTSGRVAASAAGHNVRQAVRPVKGLRRTDRASDSCVLKARSVIAHGVKAGKSPKAAKVAKTKKPRKLAQPDDGPQAKAAPAPAPASSTTPVPATAKAAASNGNRAAVVNSKSNGNGNGAAAAAANGSAAPAERVNLEDGSGDDSVAKMRSGASTVSSGIKLDGIYKTFKGNELLKGVTWDVKKGQRAGLVGVNGAGKTTQLQIVMGNLDADAGEILKARQNMRIAYLNQEFDIHPELTVREELASAFSEGMRVLQRTEAIQRELEECTDDMDRMSLLLDELDKLSNKIVDLDIATIDKKLDQMMPQLGFGPADNDRKVREYSGGWQMRMCLGKILLQDPDLLLLDEPTNHLDLDAIEWLEGYIKSLEIPTVIVSHDREFLDQVCTKIVETERGVATTYTGNYTEYLVQKTAKVGQQYVAYDKWIKEVQKQKDIIRRLSAGGQSGRAATAEKTLEKLNADPLTKPFEERKRSFRFPPVENMGEMAVEVSGLTHGYNGRLLFDNVDLEIGKGERLAVIGPNGAGKSTLLRLIMGTEQPQQGQVRMGLHSIVPNYYQQNQSEALDLSLSVIETLEHAADEAKQDEIKALLGKMMFSKASFEKKVGVLSGGEKARLALAKFMLTKGTLLVLDEPTNHLDIPSKEMLEEAVRNFEGSVIAVSHDRYFLKQIATRIANVENRQIVDYVGDYDYYLQKNDVEAEKMAVKEAKAAVITASTIKSTSKMSKAEKVAQKKQKAKEFEAQKGGTKKKGTVSRH